MLFFCNSEGTITKSKPEPVYQGSSNAVTIQLIAPSFANAQVQATFKLPNGVWLNPALPMKMETELNGTVNPETGQPYSGWSLPIKKALTEYSGVVEVQFFFFTSNADVAPSSSMTSFVVSKGVPYYEPETPSPEDEVYSVYQQLLTNLAFVQERMGLQYIIDIEEDSDKWVEADGVYKIILSYEEYKIPNITSVEVLLRDASNEGECFENILYTKKIYLSGNVAVTFDKKINCRVILKGDSNGKTIN